MEFWRVNRPDGVPGGVPDGVPYGVKVGYGQTVAIVASDRHRDERLAQTLLRQGARVVIWYDGEIPPPAHLVIIDGDAEGGSDRAEDRLRRLQNRLSCPVAVITGWCREQTFPADPVERPIRLRAPLSAVTARVLMDYVAARLPA